jgi:hypothetical protein
LGRSSWPRTEHIHSSCAPHSPVSVLLRHFMLLCTTYVHSSSRHWYSLPHRCNASHPYPILWFLSDLDLADVISSQVSGDERSFVAE